MKDHQIVCISSNSLNNLLLTSALDLHDLLINLAMFPYDVASIHSSMLSNIELNNTNGFNLKNTKTLFHEPCFYSKQFKNHNENIEF